MTNQRQWESNYRDNQKARGHVRKALVMSEDDHPLIMDACAASRDGMLESWIVGKAKEIKGR